MLSVSACVCGECATFRCFGLQLIASATAARGTHSSIAQACTPTRTVTHTTNASASAGTQGAHHHTFHSTTNQPSPTQTQHTTPHPSAHHPRRSPAASAPYSATSAGQLLMPFPIMTSCHILYPVSTWLSAYPVLSLAGGCYPVLQLASTRSSPLPLLQPPAS